MSDEIESTKYHPAINEMFHDMGQEILFYFQKYFKAGYAAACKDYNPAKGETLGKNGILHASEIELINSLNLPTYDEKKLNDHMEKEFSSINSLDMFCEEIKYKE